MIIFLLNKQYHHDNFTPFKKEKYNLTNNLPYNELAVNKPSLKEYKWLTLLSKHFYNLLSAIAKAFLTVHDISL